MTETTPAIADFSHRLAAEELVNVAARAGARIMHHYAASTEVTLKSDKSPLTQADLDCHTLIEAALKELAPGIALVSEEDAGDRNVALPSRFFLVDPLDGTKEFIQKRSDFTVNVALIENGIPTFGLVYAPARELIALTLSPGEAVEAKLSPNERGATLAELQLRPLRCRQPDENGLVAVVSHSHLDQETEDFLAQHKIAGRSSAGSSLKFLLVARGDADVYPRFGPTMEWDTAAGHAVLAAAAGRVVNTDGSPFRYGKSETGLKNPGFIAWGAAN